MQTIAIRHKHTTMKSTLNLLIICIFFPGSIFCQDSTLNAVCNQLASSLTNSLDQHEKVTLYNSIVDEALISIPDSLHEPFLNALDSNCLTVKTLKESSLEAFFVTEEEPIINFLSNTCEKEWTSDEVEVQINKLKDRNNYSENFTASIVYELCKHIIYEDYIFLGEFVQYRLIERLANHLKNEQKLNE